MQCNDPAVRNDAASTKIASLPMSNSAADFIVGIVSIGDVVKHLLTQMQREYDALRDYIWTA